MTVLEAFQHGVKLHEQGRLAQAEAMYRQILLAAPRHAETLGNLGLLLEAEGRSAEALDCLVAAIAQKPRYAEAHNNLGNTLHSLGRYAEALHHYRTAIAICPSYANAHWNLALEYLRRGDLRAAWPEYEWRWTTGVQVPRSPALPQPLWRGEDPRGKRVLLYAEQGLGDTLHMIRYAAVIAERGGEVLVEAQRELATLLRRAPGVAQWITQGEALPAFDLQCPLLSAPLALATTLETIPARVPYLSPAPEKTAAWRDRLPPAGPRLRVGVAWAGSPGHWEDHRRSLALQALAPVLAWPGADFFSLQKGPPAEQARAFPALQDYTAELEDFSDTAALISQLDLVISVDSAVAHLAGALSKSVWTLLPRVADWRWMREREDSPWYPTMRLFRQKVAGEWHDPVERLVTALEEVTREPASRLPA